MRILAIALLFISIQSQAKIKVVMKKNIEILPQAAKISDIPALPASLPRSVEPMQPITPVASTQPATASETVVPAQPSTLPAAPSSTISALPAPSKYYVSRTTVADQSVFSRLSDGSPDQISLQFKTCFDSQIAQPNQNLVLTDGMMNIYAKLDAQNCFIWFQDLTISSFPLSEGAAGVLQYIPLKRFLRLDDGREYPQTFNYYPRIGFVTEATPRGQALTNRLVLLNGEAF